MKSALLMQQNNSGILKQKAFRFSFNKINSIIVWCFGAYDHALFLSKLISEDTVAIIVNNVYIIFAKATHDDTIIRITLCTL